MTRFARNRAVFVFEEPRIDGERERPGLDIRTCPQSGVVVVTPLLSSGEADVEVALRQAVDLLVSRYKLKLPVLWYYTPLMRGFSRHIEAAAVVYDCMDELASFRFAPAGLADAEVQLLADADVVFTGGHTLYEAKRHRHRNVHAFPSSVDVAHFAKARARGVPEPGDQSGIPHPRLGYFGVIDERMDYELLAAVADARPEWHLVLAGPLAKVSPSDLPVRPNLHFLGMKEYDALPQYLGGWDAALIPFAINEATKFISPTKTPEYLAGGRPVVSTAIRDVERSYGHLEGVGIGRTPEAFVQCCDAALEMGNDGDWLVEADALLSRQSWDATCHDMEVLVRRAVTARRPVPVRSGVLPLPLHHRFDAVVVGAGFAGAVMAERLAAGSGLRVLVIDKRPHVAGNAYDCVDAAGVMIHQYGPHIFHTNSQKVFNYLSRFTSWRPYEHRVRAAVAGRLLPIPINRTTLNELYGMALRSEEEVAEFLRLRAEIIDPVLSARDVVLSTVGPELYRTFFEGYTRKQWGVDPSQLDRAVTARVPARYNDDDRYFTDTLQFMPREGYTAMFERMLDHPNITLGLGVAFADVKDAIGDLPILYSGPVDEFFDHRFGPLPYRSLRFEHRTFETAQFQPVAVVNYPDEDVPYTRISEYKHLTGQVHPRTSVSYEYPCADGDPYYPVPCDTNRLLYQKYEALAAALPNVVFIGRLGTYRYYNMDQVVAQALAVYDRQCDKLFAPRRRATASSSRPHALAM